MRWSLYSRSSCLLRIEVKAEALELRCDLGELVLLRVVRARGRSCVRRRPRLLCLLLPMGPLAPQLTLLVRKRAALDRWIEERRARR